MSCLFGGARKTNVDTIKGFQRKVTSDARGMDREIARIDAREAILQRDLTKCAKENNISTATVKAKEIVRLRAHRARLHSFKGQMGGLAQQLQEVHTTGKIQESVGSAVHMLHTLNTRMDAAVVARMLTEFEKQNVQMKLKQELMEEALDEGFEADGEQDDCNTAVIAVLEDVGLDARAQLDLRSRGSLAREPTASEDDIASRLERLRTQ